MTITTVSKTRKATLLAAGIAGLLLAMMLTACKSAPNLTGRWFATGKTLANGEQQKAILDLKQDGNQLTGNVRGLGFQTDVKGTVNGSHFELFGVDWNDKKPFLTGDLVEREHRRNAMGRQVHRPAGYSGGRVSEAGVHRPSSAAQGALQRPGQNTSHGMEQLESLRREGRRPDRAHDGRRDDVERHEGRRLHLRQYRRHLGRRARCERRAVHEQEVSRHEGACRLRALQGPEDRDLLVARSAHLRRLSRQLRPRRAGRQDVSRPGASIT